MPKRLTQEEVNELRTVFLQYDIDGDGSITTKELDIAMRAMGLKPTEAELRDLMSAVDTDGDGSLNFKEFLAVMAARMDHGENEEDVIQAFRMFDRDHNGFISIDELRFVLTNLGEKLSDEEAEELMREADVDDDGQINYEEFVLMLRK